MQNNLGRRLVGAMLFGVVVYGVLVFYRGTEKISAELATFAWSSFAIACGLSFINYILRFLKWEYYLAILEIRGVPKLTSFLTFLSGFVLTVTPGKVGEVFKSLILQEVRGIPVERTASIVVAERVTDLIGVIVLIAVGSSRFPGGVVWMSAGLIFVLAILVLVGSPAVGNWVVATLPKLPGPLGRFGARVAAKMAEVFDRLRTITAPRHLVWPTLLSVVGWGLEGVGLWIILGGFGEHTSLPLTGFFYATATLAGALIPVPGGLGVTDKLLEEQMARLGSVPAAKATSAMLLARFATLWFAVIVGFIALAILRAMYPSLRATNAPSQREDVDKQSAT
ncbi:MAG: flippase-like domain-containing protein [Polyangiaceae bacterium]|nr:flippase-like domain-containing protein [Polyangiaceae bacterium]